MKFMLTASSISSIAISRMMTFLRLRKIPTMLIANSTAPRTRKCDSDSKVCLFFLFRRHRNTRTRPGRSPSSAATGYAWFRCRRKRKNKHTLLSLSHFLVLGAVLFAISIVGIFLNRKNVIILLMAIELMLLAVNMNFIAFSHYLGDIAGQVFVFFILTVAAAESAIGLAILVVLFRNLQTINVDDLDNLKG